MSRISDRTLAESITSAEVDWWRVTLPVTVSIGADLAGRDFSGKTVACFQHVLADLAPTLLPLVRAGARVRLAAVNPDSTNDAAAAYLDANGVEVWAWSHMSEAEWREGREWLLSEPADVLSDMGGELIAGTVGKGASAVGALEATTSGLRRLAAENIPFPVFNWNDATLKNQIHNRHHVGMETWPAFTNLTGLTVHGRSVLVVGFGPVGRGVALHARKLGANVSVADVDPVRALEAQQHGCRDVELDEGLESATIVVTATGIDGILGPRELELVRGGTILLNVGHSNREIDVPWLLSHPHERVRASLDRFEIDGRNLYLLNRGSLVNLAPAAGGGAEDLFDPFSALIVRGLAWMLDGEAAGYGPGIHPYPAELEAEVAARARAARLAPLG